MSYIPQKNISAFQFFFLQRLPYPEYYLLLLITITYYLNHYQMPVEKLYPGYFCYSLLTHNYIKLKRILHCAWFKEA